MKYGGSVIDLERKHMSGLWVWSFLARSCNNGGLCASSDFQETWRSLRACKIVCYVAYDFSIYREKVLKALVIRIKKSHVMLLKLAFEANKKCIVSMWRTRACRVVNKLYICCFFLWNLLESEEIMYGLKELTLWLKLAFLKWKCYLCAKNGLTTWTMAQSVM